MATKMLQTYSNERPDVSTFFFNNSQNVRLFFKLVTVELTVLPWWYKAARFDFGARGQQKKARFFK